MNAPRLPGVTLHQGPVDWQIVQQDATGQARIDLSGGCRCTAPRQQVQLRVVHQDTGRPVTAALDWRRAQRTGPSRWRARLLAPAGGLYRLETRVWRAGDTDNRPMRGDYVHHWGVGDLWLIAGQSNAAGAGRGPVVDPPTLGVHQLGTDDRWQLARHPLDDATRTHRPVLVHGIAQGHSAWLTFGRHLQAALGYPIGLIPAACGGSSLLRWLPGADLFRNLQSMLGVAGGAARGIVWYQGESEALAGTTTHYARDFARVHAGLRALSPRGLPILSAQLARYRGKDDDAAAWTALRETQRHLAAHLLRTPLVPTVDLELGDDIHLSAAANLVLGQRFAVAALSSVYARSEKPPCLELTRWGWHGRGRRRVRLEFTPAIASWLPRHGAGGFEVRDVAGIVPIQEVNLQVPGRVDLLLARPPRDRTTVSASPGADPGPAVLCDHDLRPVSAFRVSLPK